MAENSLQTESGPPVPNHNHEVQQITSESHILFQLRTVLQFLSKQLTFALFFLQFERAEGLGITVNSSAINLQTHQRRGKEETYIQDKIISVKTSLISNVPTRQYLSNFHTSHSCDSHVTHVQKAPCA